MKTRRMAVCFAALLCCMLMTSPTRAGDNGDGTITINGLVWLKNACCIGAKSWSGAKNAAATLASGQCGLTDRSSAGQWRLPNIDELKSVHASKSNFIVHHDAYYWSSTSSAIYPESYKLALYMYNCFGYPRFYEEINFVWPVRN